MTHLPYEDFTKSSMVLEPADLAKQYLDGYLILDALIAKRTRWSNHNAVVMWRGAEVSLWKYVSAVCMEMQDRNMGDGDELEKISTLIQDAMSTGHLDATNGSYRPWWLGKEGFHKSHRSQLLLRNPAWYHQYFTQDVPGLGYVWPEYRPPVLVKQPVNSRV